MIIPKPLMEFLFIFIFLFDFLKKLIAGRHVSVGHANSTKNGSYLKAFGTVTCEMWNPWTVQETLLRDPLNML